MTIHSEHPFLDPERDPLRRFRGRMPAPVTVLTCGTGAGREGWTVSSLLVADGEPPEIVALVDADSDLADALGGGTSRLVVNLLGPDHRGLADAFARVAPAPGGPFTVGSWSTSPFGPVLDGAAGWLGVEVTDLGAAGWLLLVRGRIAHVELGEEHAVLAHVRGRYRTLDQ